MALNNKGQPRWIIWLIMENSKNYLSSLLFHKDAQGRQRKFILHSALKHNITFLLYIILNFTWMEERYFCLSFVRKGEKRERQRSAGLNGWLRNQIYCLSLHFICMLYLMKFYDIRFSLYFHFLWGETETATASFIIILMQHIYSIAIN